MQKTRSCLPGLGGGESGELLLNRYRVSVWKMKCSGDGWQQWRWFHSNVNTLNATVHVKTGKIVNSHVSFTALKRLAHVRHVKNNICIKVWWVVNNLHCRVVGFKVIFMFFFIFSYTVNFNKTMHGSIKKSEQIEN